MLPSARLFDLGILLECGELNDFDTVDETNLPPQILFDGSDVVPVGGRDQSPRSGFSGQATMNPSSFGIRTRASERAFMTSSASMIPLR